MQTIGERLEEARKRKGISIREAAEATKVRGDYLHKFESNQFDINLPEIYVRGFLRTYAGYLKLSPDKITADYNALGIGQAKARPLNREIYGRMDLSVASAAKDTPPAASSGAAPAPATPPAEEAARNPATFVPRASGLNLDRPLLIKIGALAGGAIVLIFLLVWGISALTNDRTVPANTATGTQSARMITLVALNEVTTTVMHQNPDGSEGPVIFSGTLRRGETREVPWPGPVFISANAGENLELEFRGERYPVSFTGRGRARLE